MNKAMSFLGLIQKAGFLSSGDDTVERDIKKGKCYLLIIAKDASENTQKSFEQMAAYRNIKYVYCGTKDELGKYIGKSQRSVVAIKDVNLAKVLLSKIDNENGGDHIDDKGKDI